jgi:hypothetical protein
VRITTNRHERNAISPAGIECTGLKLEPARTVMLFYRSRLRAFLCVRIELKTKRPQAAEKPSCGRVS